jgi:hypothetical protein
MGVVEGNGNVKDRFAWVASVFVLGLSIALNGWFIGHGFLEGRKGDRYVTVKGVSERSVKADLALWPIRFVATGNELSTVQADIEQAGENVVKFLAEQGIPGQEIELQNLKVTDLYAQAYRSGPVENRFIITQTLMVRSHNVDRIAGASQRQAELVDAGVVLDGNSGPGGAGPFYLFTRLSEFKPDMIAEATRNARAAATQFAADSESLIGGIRRANQGLFQILPQNNPPGVIEQNQIRKTLRVVSTIEYLLVQ